MQDTLSYVAQNDTIQQLVVVLQGLFLVIGALLNLFNKKG